MKFDDPKDPDEVLDYHFDWTVRLGDDEIATSNVSHVTAAGTVIDSQSFSNDTTLIIDGVSTPNRKASTVWVSGGTIPSGRPTAKAVFHCRITTTGGRTMDQSADLTIKSK